MLKLICDNFKKHAAFNAIHIKGQYYNYCQLGSKVTNISKRISNLSTDYSNNIGLIVNNDFETYASILAIIISGYGFVPIDLNNPISRNKAILKQSGLKIVLRSNNSILPVYFNEMGIIDVAIDEKVELTDNFFDPVIVPEEQNAYILYTSGSTGEPKGVPISRKNLRFFLDAFFDVFPKICEEDRFLQMYDITFDAFIMHFFPALCRGACVYTIPKESVKYLEAIKVLIDFKITFSLLMPSTLAYLQQYFNSITLTDLKYSLFGGEAVSAQLIKNWIKCVPNADIYNAYGPTEATVFVMIYKMNKKNVFYGNYNGLIPIGQPIKGVKIKVVDEKMHEVDRGNIGELLVNTPQLTSGYLDPKMDEGNFFFVETDKSERYYCTGDLVRQNLDGDYVFCCRKDGQVQVDGYRIELGEIENITRKVIKDINNLCVVIYHDIYGSSKIALFITGSKFDKGIIKRKLSDHLPRYMLPEKIIYISEMPLTSNGKIDTKELKRLI